MWKVEREIGGRRLSIETGDLARQADGAVVVRYGETVVLATAVAEAGKGKDLPFLPLTVEYREKQYAAGKFPGGIIKREGRPTTKEVLTMRLIDRPVRPLFPDGWNNEIQIVASVLSADDENDPDLLALIGASAALSISDIPWDGPIGAARVGLCEDEFIVNPTYEQRDSSEMDLVVASFGDKVTMVEGRVCVIPEEDVVTAISCGHEAAAILVEMIEELVAQCGRPKRDFQSQTIPQELVDRLESSYYEKVRQAHATAQKRERGAAIRQLRDEAVAELCVGAEDEAPTEKQIASVFDTMENRALRQQIMEENVRYDGRAPEDCRPVACSVSVLPRTHGSALFTRGETQALVITTLGTVADEQRVLDPLTEEPPKKFMLHYNFPPFSVGEARPMRGPGRREIGHGELAERALRTVLPDTDEFPYTIRLVADILESNGSSSMAAVCGGTLSMMDAGIPITDPVAGVSMGLIQQNGTYKILTDIAGPEDHFGDMDLKVAGTQRGITTLQFDVKVRGVSVDVLREAIAQARRTRIDILKTMLNVLRRPREELSPHAPMLYRVKIDTEKIGLLIGPGGRTIKKLQATYGCEIEVEDDGTVTVSGTGDSRASEAAAYIESMGQQVEVGKVYTGVVTELKDFGAIVEIFPGTDGLVHISQLDEGYVKSVQDVCSVGSEMVVKVLDVEDNRIRLSRKAALREAEQAE